MANNPRNRENLRNFKKGQSGNPKGRPPIVKDLREFIKEKLAGETTSGSGVTKLEAITTKLLHMANSGNMKAMELALAYGYGKPREDKSIDFNIRNEIPLVQIMLPPKKIQLPALIKLPVQGKNGKGK